jgi:hypothetical protein
MVREQERVVVDPHRPHRVERGSRKPLPVAGHKVEAAADLTEQLLAARRRPGEGRDRADVHVLVAVLEV